MEKRYYIDGKCVLSYDDDVFSTDDDYTNIKELFIYPAVDKVYVKYYEKQLVQQVLEKTLKKNDSIFNTYCAIKELIKDEPISVDYVQSEEDTLLKNLMRKNLIVMNMLNLKSCLMKLVLMHGANKLIFWDEEMV